MKRRRLSNWELALAGAATGASLFIAVLAFLVYLATR